MSYPYVMYSSQFSHNSWKRILVGVITILIYLISLGGLVYFLLDQPLIFGLSALGMGILYVQMAQKWMRGFKEKKLKILRFNRDFRHFEYEYDGVKFGFVASEVSVQVSEQEVAMSVRDESFTFPAEISTAGSFRTQLHLFGTGNKFFDYFAIIERSFLGFKLCYEDGDLKFKAYGRFEKFWPTNKVY
jgi:hypothetical protein